MVNSKGGTGGGRRAIGRGIKVGNVLCIPRNKFNFIRVRQHDLTFVYQEVGTFCKLSLYDYFLI